MLRISRLVRFFLVAAFFCLACAASLAQTATVSGTLTNASSGGVGTNAYLKAELYGCGGNRAIWSGGVVTQSFNYVTDANGAISGTIVRNDQITCGNDVGNATSYFMQPFVNGQQSGPRLQFRVTSGTFNWNTATPITVQPVVPAPTGDATYSRLDGGNQPFTGDVSLLTINNKARIFVDRYATWALALAACPAAGCILDATSPNTPRAMGSFDVGTKQVKVEFGPFSNFTADHIVLRAGIWLQGLSSATNATVITSVGANSQALLVIPAQNNIQVFGFKVDGIRFLALPGNTSQEGLLSDVSGCTNCNLNYGIFSNLFFYNFVGSAIHLKGRTLDANAANQFLWFNNITAIRPSGTTERLRIDGYAGQIHFDSCEFDGASNNDGGDNIYLGSGGGTNTQTPNTIFFDNLTSQAGTVDIHCDGCQDVDVARLHSEGTLGILLVSNSSSGILVSANPFIHLHDSFISSTSANSSGNGYVVSVTDTAIGGPRVVVENNLFGGNPDTIEKCANTNSCQVIARNNFALTSPSGAAPTSNITPAQSPAATFDVKNWNHIGLSASGTSITTIKGNLLPGEMVTFTPFATGGNLNLGSNSSPLICNSGDAVTFMRSELNGAFMLVAASPGCMNAVKVASQVVTSVSGNTGKVATVSGALTSGNSLKSDASGNVVDSGGVGTITIGSGTVTTAGTTVNAGVSQAQSGITVTGATATDIAICSVNAAHVATWQTGIQVVTTNTVTVWLSNPTAGNITPAAVTVRCTVVR